MSSMKKAVAKKKSTKSLKSPNAGRDANADGVGKVDRYTERGVKRERSDIGKGPGLKKRPRLKDKPSGSSIARSPMTEKLKSSHKNTLKELRKLSKEGSKIDQMEKIKRTKDCLLKLGSQISKLAATNETVQTELWTYVHQSCRTNWPGDRLGMIYLKLAENLRKKDKSVNGASRADRASGS
jgi:hypothetical protein